jgi:superfamily I DNA/RNA helicase
MKVKPSVWNKITVRQKNIEAANTIIDKNKTKLDKIVWTANDFGPKIKVHRSMTDAEEGRFVAEQFSNKNAKPNE